MKVPGGPGADLLRFGRFELDPLTGDLRRDGARVRLTPQPARLLTLLALRAGELVTRPEIRDHLWGQDVHVEVDQGINAVVREVRRTLGDDAASPRFVATVPRRGYRFVAPVERLTKDGRETVPVGKAADASEGASPRRRAVRWARPGVGAALAAAGVAALSVLPHAPGGDGAGSPERPARLLGRGLAFDEDVAEAHLMAGKDSFYADLDFVAARKAFERALELDPGSAESHLALAGLLAAEGRHAEARAALRRAAVLEPDAPAVRSDACWFHLFARRWDEAAAAAERALGAVPDDPSALECRIVAHLERGELVSAVAAAAEAGRAARDRPESLRIPGREPSAGEEAAWMTFREAGERGVPQEAVRAYWRWRIELLQAAAGDPAGVVSGLEMAVPHVYLGEVDAALELLEKGSEEGIGWRRPFLAVDPEFDALRGEPRFERLVASSPAAGGGPRGDARGELSETCADLAGSVSRRPTEASARGGSDPRGAEAPARSSRRISEDS